jgi:hypothetical protein
MRKPTKVLIVIAIIALALLMLHSPAISTHRRMGEFRTRISPGMSVAELHAFAGTPAKILHRGEPLQAARRSYTIPAINEHTAIHFYPKEGWPYFNVYVFIDERQGTVIRSDIENLWW